MACACGLNGSLIIDLGAGGERRSKPQRRGGLSALFSINVTAKQGSTALEIELWHKDDNDTSYTLLGSFASISTTGVHTKYLTGIKQVYYWLYMIDAAGDPDRFVADSPTAQFFD